MQVTVPAGMRMGTTVTLNNGQLAELLVALDKHKKIHALETEIGHLQRVNSSLIAELRSLARKNEEAALDNENLQRKALPDFPHHDAQRAIGIIKITDRWLGYMELLRGKKDPVREAFTAVEKALSNSIVTTSYYEKEEK